MTLLSLTRLRELFSPKIKCFDEDLFYDKGVESLRKFDSLFCIHSQRISLDHIGYKFQSSEKYEEARRSFEYDSSYVYTSIIGGRRISYVKLNRPFDIASGRIDFLELADQKPDGSQIDGFDHIEIFPSTKSSLEESAGRSTDISGVLPLLRGIGPVVRNENGSSSTYDLQLDGFKVKLRTRPLIEKIVLKEMQIPIRVS